MEYPVFPTTAHLSHVTHQLSISVSEMSFVLSGHVWSDVMYVWVNSLLYASLPWQEVLSLVVVCFALSSLWAGHLFIFCYLLLYCCYIGCYV